MSFTTTFALTKPASGTAAYDVPINADLDTIDSLLGGVVAHNGFRLTLVTATPVPLTDQTGKATVYLTPTRSKFISLYDPTTPRWTMLTSAEINIALASLTSGKNYDVFAFSNAGVLTLELSAAWSSDTARTDTVVQQDGVWVKSSAKTRRLVGTIRTTGTTTTEDSAAKRFVWNVDNRVLRSMYATDATATWAYSTTTFRQANAGVANQLDYVVGLAEDMVAADVSASWVQSTNPGSVAVGVGVDSTTVDSSLVGGAGADVTTAARQVYASYKGIPGLGRHFLVWLEKGAAATTTWNGTTGVFKSGIHGSVAA